jgi:ATP-dependent exoDNAse (exonuclease V) alpha subunit
LPFFLTDNQNDTIFVLKGYAGTGKTTVISTIVNNLVEIDKICSSSSNGRAAKVIANYSSKPAFTIHKKNIFSKKNAGGLSFTSTKQTQNTIFYDES